MIRITGGELRGRAIVTPPSLQTRPTQAKLRQALFNSLQLSIPDAQVLDLFAGSGALGFEALSRGAAGVVFIELDRKVASLIAQNGKELGVSDRMTIITGGVFETLDRWSEKGPYDVVLADPPYEGGWETRLLAELPWDRLLGLGSKFCLEWGALKSKAAELPEKAPFLVKTREKNYGDSVLTTYSREDSGP